MTKLIEIDYEPGRFNDGPPAGGGVSASAPPVSKLVPVDYEPQPYEGATAPAPPQGVVLPSIKRVAGQFVESVGTTIEDITGENAVTRGLQDFGGGVVKANPSQINSVGDILENPWTTIKEAVAEQVPQLGAAFTGARLGAMAGAPLGPVGVAGGALIGGLAPIFIQEYGEIRGKQKESGEGNIPLAIGGAGVATALERFGLEKLATKAGAKGFGEVLDAIPEGTSRLAHAGKQLIKTGLVEGPLTEVPQTAIERYAGGQNIGTAEAFDEYALAGAKGAIGGGVIGGGLGLVAPREQPPSPQPSPARGEGEDAAKVDDRTLTPGAAAPPAEADGAGAEISVEEGLHELDPAAQQHMQDILQGGPPPATSMLGQALGPTPPPPATSMPGQASGPLGRAAAAGGITAAAPGQANLVNRNPDGQSARNRGPLSPLGAEMAEQAKAEVAAEQARMAAQLPEPSEPAVTPPSDTTGDIKTAGPDPLRFHKLNTARTEPKARTFAEGLAGRFPDHTFEVVPHRLTKGKFAVKASPRATVDQAAHAAATLPQNEKPEPTPAQATPPLTEYSGSHSDGEKWKAAYDVVKRTDGSFALVRTFEDIDGRREEHLTAEGRWKKGRPATTAVTLGRGLEYGKDNAEKFFSESEARKAAEDDAVDMGGQAAGVQATPPAATIDAPPPATSMLGQAPAALPEERGVDASRATELQPPPQLEQRPESLPEGSDSGSPGVATERPQRADEGDAAGLPSAAAARDPEDSDQALVSAESTPGAAAATPAPTPVIPPTQSLAQGEIAAPGARPAVDSSPEGAKTLETHETPADAKPGLKATVKTASGRSAEVHYALAEADDLVVSNDEVGHINPDYPKALQPRDRSRVAMQAQVAAMAGSLDPARLGESQLALQGAPIMGPDGVIESGNGRSMAISRAYREGKAEPYRRYLEENAERFGIDRAAIKGMRAPVLVRRRISTFDDNERLAFVREANQTDVAAMSPVEQAFADAARLDAEAFATYRPSEDGDILARSNDAFRAIFLKGLSSEERNALMTADGRPTKQLVDRIQAAVFARAYGDERLLGLLAEEADPDIKTIVNALNAAAGAFVRARSLNEQLTPYNIIPALVEGADFVRETRRTGQAVQEAIAQQDLFGGRDPNALALAMFMDANKRSPKRLGEGFRAMAEFIEKELVRAQNQNLFAETPPTLGQVIARVNDFMKERYGQEDAIQPDLFSQPERSAPIAQTRPESREPDESARAGAQGAEAAEAVEKPAGFDPEAFDKARADRIAASRASGAKHVDDFPFGVESLRGKQIHYVHDPKVRGEITTVTNRGDFVVWWQDKYSSDENRLSAQEAKDKKGKVIGFESWLPRSDAADYVVDNPQYVYSADTYVAPGAKPKKPKQKKPAWDEALRAYFVPGAIVKGYGGYDRILAFEVTDAKNQTWRVKVESVKKTAEGQWETNGIPRWHSTTPDGKTLKAGPAVPPGPVVGAETPEKAAEPATKAVEPETKAAKAETPKAEKRPAAKAETWAGERYSRAPEGPAPDPSTPEGSAAQTETPEFKRWFGASKVVDTEGRPKRVYHGTAADFNVFAQNKTATTRHPSRKLGFFFTESAEEAGQFATLMRTREQGANILPVYLSLQHPASIGSKAFFEGTATEEQAQAYKARLAAAGHDGIAIKFGDGRMQYVVFGSEQVKSAASNTGAFDPNNPDIRYSSQKPGTVGLSVYGARKTLAKRFGAGVGRLIEAGILKIVQSEHELPAHLNDGKGGIRGVYDPTGDPLTGEGADMTWMVADNLTAADAPKVFLHEVGTHYGLERMLGSEKYQEIIRQMRVMEVAGDKAVRAGRAAIPNDTPKAAVDDELLAYLVEKHPELPLAKRIIAAIRAFLFRQGLIKNIRPEDVVALAKAAARHAARPPTLPSPVRRGRIEEGALPAYSGSPLWYSEMAKFIDAKAPGKTTAAQWKVLLDAWAKPPTEKGDKPPKFKREELEWSGLKEFLDLQQGAVTKDQVLGFVRENGVRVEETVLGRNKLLDPQDERRLRYLQSLNDMGRLESGEQQAEYLDLARRSESSGTEGKFAKWQLPGGENYREVLLRLSMAEAMPEGFRVEETAGGKWAVYSPLGSHLGNWPTRESAIKSQRLQVGAKAFFSSHFGDEPNILAHVRFNERTDSDGKRVLFIEEIQSDWAQKGKREGFKPKDDAEFQALTKELEAVRAVQEKGEAGQPAYEGAVVREGKIIDRMNEINDAKIPQAPFVGKTEAWVALALKRMIRYGAENGFDRIAWTTGEQQADRYPEALRKVIDSISWTTEANGNKRVTGDKDGRTVFFANVNEKGIVGDASSNEMNGKHAADVFGKDMSQKILGEPKGNLSGIDFNVGGHGMKVFYGDSRGLKPDGTPAIIPNVANALLKKLGGGRVREGAKIVGPDIRPASETSQIGYQPGFDITPALRESAMRGVPLFSKKADKGPLAPNPQEADAFRSALDKAMGSLRSVDTPITVGKTPAVLARLGAPDLPVVITRDTVRKATNRVKHNVRIEDIRKLPEALADPVMVFESKTQPNSLVVLTEFQDENGRSVVVTLHLSRQHKHYIINQITSVHGRSSDAHIVNWVKAGLARYIHTAKTPAWLQSRGLQLPKEGALLGSGNRLITERDIVKRAAHGGPIQGPLFSRAEPPPDLPRSEQGRGSPAPDPNTPEGSAAAVDRIGEAMRGGRHGWNAIKSKMLHDWRPAWLGLFTRRQLVDIGEAMVPALASYNRAVEAMDADRNRFDEEAHEVAEVAAAYVKGHKKEADELFDLMHAATLSGVDPAHDYRPSILRQEAYQQIASLKRRMRSRPGEADVLQVQINEIRTRLDNEKVRKLAYPALEKRYAGLSEDARAVYAQMRDLYSKRFDEREAALIQRIKDAEADERWKSRLIADIQRRFETARLLAPYFPLVRFGDYWVAATNPSGEREFHLRESAHQQQALRTELEAGGYRAIEHGFKMDKLFEEQGASAGFVTEIIKVIDSKAGPRSSPALERIKDEIYQIYLHTLPEMSSRRHWIHRQKTPGFSQDALRGFAKQMFHGNRQLARLRQQSDMEKALAKMRKQAREASDPNRAAHLVNEMQKRDEWIKNPTTASWANAAGGLGFLWYLTAPASAIVNVTQTPLVAYPLLAARHGWGAAAKALTGAMGDYFKGRFSVEGALKGEELDVYRRFLADGLIDKTQSHDLAGMSETPSAIYSGRTAKIMRASSFLFHRAERMNREITALAAFRLARAKGLDLNAAYEEAKAMTWESHFDYMNSNKARFIQRDVPRVLFMFKQFSQHITYLLGRSAHQSLKGLTGAARREARVRLTGLLGMHALFAGALGMPLMGTLAFVMNALFDDDDEPYDFELEFRNFLADAFGPEVGQAIVRGPVESLTGLGVAHRVGLSDLWFREPDKTLEGRGLVEYWTEQLLGPLGGIALKAGTAYEMFQDGNTARALESMTPAAIRSGLQMLRYADKGAQSLRGDPVMEDMSTWNLLGQAAGFSPAELGQKYDVNRAIKNLEDRIKTRRDRLINRWWLARRTGHMEGVQEAMAEIRKFNESTSIRQNPRARITPATLLASTQARRNYSRRAEGGIIVDPRLARLPEQVRFAP